jgi:lysophospholipase L1-like esterase
MALLVVLAAGAVAVPSWGDTVSRPVPPVFSWSVPEAFGERGENGRFLKDQPDSVKKGPWPVDLHVAPAACSETGVYRWSVDGAGIRTERVAPCTFRISLPHEGPYSVALRAESGGRRFSAKRRIVVEDELIVSIGDSVAAGEGVPDIAGLRHATWQSRRCHRSAKAGPALAAREIERDDPHTSVTFVHLACSGATIPAGLLGGFVGAETDGEEPPLEAQTAVLARLAAIRPIDALLLSVGANDVHFGEVVRFCAIPGQPNCFEERFRPPGGDPDERRTTAAVVAGALHELPRRYEQLAKALRPLLPASKVHIVEYFDPTGDSDGRTCRRILGGATRAELERARSEMLEPLNEAVGRAARRWGWEEVTGAAEAFRTHGYCAKRPWVTRVFRSLFTLGGSPVSKRLLGTLHPNERGQQEIGDRITVALEGQLFPRRTFPPPVRAGGGDDRPSIVSRVLEAPATAVVLGVLLAVLLLISPFSGPLRDTLAALGRTVRPLLLPLLVVVAVGAVQFSFPIAVLVALVAVAVAWLAIVVPSAAESELPDNWLTALWHGARSRIPTLLAVLLALWVLGRPIVRSTPYFQTLATGTSFLVVAAIALWFAAIGLRLVSFGRTRIRTAVALLVGLALLRLAMALGLLPGEPGLRDTVPLTVPVLLSVAVALLLADVVLRAAPAGPLASASGWLRTPWLTVATTSRAATLGFLAVLGASVMLLLGTVLGLVEAAERGGSLNPPDGVSEAAPVVGALPQADQGELIRRYAPVLVFTQDEHWTPIAVDQYLEHATLVRPGGTPEESPRLEDLPRRCPGGGRDCFHLTIGCESGALPCAHGRDLHRDPERLYEEGAVYVRGPLTRTDHPGLFPSRGPFAANLKTLIQYWYFYYYDEWQAPVFAGLLTQKHEADWEVVTLGLDAGDVPLFVADSAHCSGTWRKWAEVEASTQLSRPYTHPVVAVAEGSHANYPDPRQKRTSDPGHCAGLPEGVAAGISFASNIRDRTEYGWAWYPAPNGWLRVTPRQPGPMAFPGTWGASDRTTLTNFNVHEIGKPKPGPRTPSLQRSWTDPVGTIFCGGYRAPRGFSREEAGC